MFKIKGFDKNISSKYIIVIVALVFVLLLNGSNAFFEPNEIIAALQLLVKNAAAVTTVIIGILTVVMGIGMYKGPDKEPEEPTPIVHRIITEQELSGALAQPLLEYKEGNMMRGSRVKKVQEALKDWGCDIAADGIFGLKTKACVEQFQQSNGLTVDGIVGIQTREKLGILFYYIVS